MSFFAILFSFKGRVNRAKFWMVRFLPMIVVGIIVEFISNGASEAGSSPLRFGIVVLLIIVVGIIVEFIFSGASEAGFALLPFGIFCVWVWASLAVTAKRWHDRDKSAWWILIELIPIIGDIWAFVVLGCCKGTAGPNRFGPDPLKEQ